MDLLVRARHAEEDLRPRLARGTRARKSDVGARRDLVAERDPAVVRGRRARRCAPSAGTTRCGARRWRSRQRQAEALDRPADVGVIEHHALRRPGGARRVDDGREVVGLRRSRRRPRGRRGAAASSSSHDSTPGALDGSSTHDDVAQRRAASSRTSSSRSRNSRVLDDRDRRPGSGRRGTAICPATTSCRSRSASRRASSTADVGDVELGPVAMSMTTRSPRPTPSSAERGGEPGGLVGVLGVGQRAVVVAVLPPQRDGLGRARTVPGRRAAPSGRPRGGELAFVIATARQANGEVCAGPPARRAPSTELSTGSRWRTSARGVENLARDGEYWRAVRPEEIVGAPRERASLRRLSSGRTRVRAHGCGRASRLDSARPMSGRCMRDAPGARGSAGCRCPARDSPARRAARPRSTTTSSSATRRRRSRPTTAAGRAPDRPPRSRRRSARSRSGDAEPRDARPAERPRSTQADARLAELDGDDRDVQQKLDATRAEVARLKQSCATARRSSTRTRDTPQLDRRHPARRGHRVGQAVRGVGHATDARRITDLTGSADTLDAQLQGARERARRSRASRRTALDDAKTALEALTARQKKLLDEAGAITVMGDAELTGDEITAWFDGAGREVPAQSAA